jgi:hypothetical protein
MACPSSGVAAALDEHGAFPAPKEKGSMFPLEENGMYCSDADSHFVETWHTMEQLVEEKLCKAIGLSNFNKKQVAEVRPFRLTLTPHPKTCRSSPARRCTSRRRSRTSATRASAAPGAIRKTSSRKPHSGKPEPSLGSSSKRTSSTTASPRALRSRLIRRSGRRTGLGPRRAV